MPIPEHDRRALGWIAVAAAVIGAVYYLSPVLAPFVLAGVPACICQPLILRLDRLGLPRMPSVLRVLGLKFLLIALFASAVLLVALREPRANHLDSPFFKGD